MGENWTWDANEVIGIENMNNLVQNRPELIKVDLSTGMLLNIILTGRVNRYFNRNFTYSFKKIAKFCSLQNPLFKPA